MNSTAPGIWAPRLDEQLVDHIRAVTSGAAGSRPAAFIRPPLKRLSLLQGLLSFINRNTPRFHEQPVSLSALWRMLWRQPTWPTAGAGSVAYFDRSCAALRSFGALSLGLDTHEPRSALEAVSAAIRRAEAADVDPPLLVMSEVRYQSIRHLADRVPIFLESVCLPSLSSETLFGAASLHTVVVSVVLEYLRYRDEPGSAAAGQRSDASHALREWMTSLATPENWVRSTVGDLYWMNIYLSRWLKAGEHKNPAAGSPLGLLLRNPLFVAGRVDERLGDYPEDRSAQNQLLSFLACCSGPMRKHVTETVFLSDTAEISFDQQGLDRGVRWYEFLENSATRWAESFELSTPSEHEDASAARARAREYLQRAVKLWRAEALRLALLWPTLAGEPVASQLSAPEEFTPESLTKLQEEVIPPITPEEAIRWLGVPTLPAESLTERPSTRSVH